MILNKTQVFKHLHLMDSILIRNHHITTHTISPHIHQIVMIQDGQVAAIEEDIMTFHRISHIQISLKVSHIQCHSLTSNMTDQECLGNRKIWWDFLSSRNPNSIRNQNKWETIWKISWIRWWICKELFSSRRMSIRCQSMIERIKDMGHRTRWKCNRLEMFSTTCLIWLDLNREMKESLVFQMISDNRFNQSVLISYLIKTFLMLGLIR